MIREHKQTFEGDGYFRSPNYGDKFTGIEIIQNLSKCMPFIICIL